MVVVQAAMSTLVRTMIIEHTMMNWPRNQNARIQIINFNNKMEAGKLSVGTEAQHVVIVSQ